MYRLTDVICPACSEAATSEVSKIIAARLASKIKQKAVPGAWVVTVLGAGHDLGECLARLLSSPIQHLYIRPIEWPPGSGSFIGAMAGIRDVLYLDEQKIQALNGMRPQLMAHIQEMRIECMKTALRAGVKLDGAPDGASILLTICPHTPVEVVEAALQLVALSSPQGVRVATPFLPRAIKVIFKARVDGFVCLREFDNLDDLSQFSENLAHLKAAQVESLFSD